MSLALPNSRKNIYIIGICGTGVGALAGLLQRLGYHVRGSDEHIYPPMSTKLRDWQIEILEGYNADHLTPDIDLVIIGNVIRQNNVEALAATALKLPLMSMPAAIAHFGMPNKQSIVFTGTHGKTTTTALAAHMLLHNGYDPSFLVGGVLIDYPESFRVGNGRYFVIEGDEYDTAYFDKRPKFLHYQAQTGVITSLEFDHADIYASLAAIEKAFAAFISTIPATGHLVLWGGATRALNLLPEYAKTKNILVYDLKKPATTHHTLYLKDYSYNSEGLLFEPVFQGQSLGKMQTNLFGDMSACNVLAVIGALLPMGITSKQLQEGFRTFKGVKRRLEVLRDRDGLAIVDDFAHHPTAVKATLLAARNKFPGRKLIAIFEPRSATSRRNVFQHEFIEAFSHADLSIISTHERLNEIAEAERFNPARLVDDLQAAGKAAIFIAKAEDIISYLRTHLQTPTAILILSNGDFQGLHQKLLTAIVA